MCSDARRSPELPHGTWLDLLREDADTKEARNTGYARFQAVARSTLRRWKLSRHDVDDITSIVATRLSNPSSRATHVLSMINTMKARRAYLSAMVRTAAIDYIRNQVRYDRVLRTAPAKQHVDGDSRVRYAEALEALSSDEASLVIRRVFAGESLSEIAASLGITYTAASVRIFRIFRKLRHLHSGDGPA